MESVNDNSLPTTLIVGVSADLIEVARALGARGGQVVLMSRNRQKLEQFQERLTKWDVRSTAILVDVTDSESVLAAFKQLTKWSRRLDRLIYNVGVVSNESASEVTSSELARVMSANFFGFANCFQLAQPMMKYHGSGHVVIISGSGAMSTENESVACAASKASLTIYVKALRGEQEGGRIQFTELQLGRVQVGEGWRWLTCEEIVEGVLHVLDSRPARYRVGT